jgi:molybdate transport system substrate-binding protein
MKKTVWTRVTAAACAAACAVGLSACGSSTTATTAAATTAAATEAETEAATEAAEETTAAAEEASSDAVYTSDSGYNDEETEIQVFIAASLNTVMTDLASRYNEIHPNVKITFNADSSGKLLTQIEEGYACDVFFSAAQKQMNTLENDDKLVVEGTRKDVLNNQVVVITLKDSDTAVTGLETLKDAKSIALADGSVPVGKYTRQALVKAGILPEAEDVSKITTQEVSDALGGVEISEQSNVSKVLAAVVEGSCEVGTTYYSDTYGYEDQLDILEKVSYDLTGNVIYPIAQVQNDEADDVEKAAAKDFIDYVTSDSVKEVLESYYFDTNV